MTRQPGTVSLLPNLPGPCPGARIPTQPSCPQKVTRGPAPLEAQPGGCRLGPPRTEAAHTSQSGGSLTLFSSLIQFIFFCRRGPSPRDCRQFLDTHRQEKTPRFSRTSLSFYNPVNNFSYSFISRPSRVNRIGILRSLKFACV